MDTKKYTMTLIPVGNFFFGQEDIHVSSRRDTADDTFFYLSESAKMPQQTALLGMLRFALLSTAGSDVFSGNKIVSSQKAASLIGPKSFTKNVPGDFGRISSIGPCGLRIRYAQESRWFPLQFSPMDWGLNASFEQQNGTRVLVNDEPTSKLVRFAGYKAKKGLSNKLLVRRNGRVQEYDHDDIFKAVSQVGIDRDIQSGRVQENAYYKQKFYRFAVGKDRETFEVGFAFDIKLDASANVEPLQGLSVQLGAEDSRFIIDIHETAESFVPVYAEDGVEKDLCKVTLLSDSYLTPAEISLSVFNISDIRPFRSLSTSIETTNYYNRKRGGDGIGKSERSYLYKQGSVFFFEDPGRRDEFIDKLKSHREFYKIGFNYYK